jgi:hypothetical protein
MTIPEKIKAITKILKKRFPNLTTDETIEIACQIVEVLDEPSDKMTNINESHT